LGLGLAIVRQLIRLHGGTVEARSDGRGTGSSFIVSIPTTTDG
jgi:signal transduction histidine kinase